MRASSSCSKILATFMKSAMGEVSRRSVFRARA